MGRLIVILSVTLILISFQFNYCSSQNFDPKMEDEEYLDKIQKRLNEEVMESHQTLVNQTKMLQLVTRTFIQSKIKQNLFKMVRVRVEEELEDMAKDNGTNMSFRQARQEEDDDDRSTTSRPRQQGLLPQLANVVTTFFGSNVNVTNYVKDFATSINLPSGLSDRFVVAASLIDPQRFTSTTTLPPPVVNGQVINGTAAFGYPSSNGGRVQGGVEIGQPAPAGSPPNLGGIQQGLIQPSTQQQANLNSNPVSGSVPSSDIPLSQFQTKQSSISEQLPSSPAQQPIFGSEYQTRQQAFQQQANYGAFPQQKYQPVIIGHLPQNGLSNADATSPATSNEDENNSSGEDDNGSNTGGTNVEDDSSEVEDDLAISFYDDFSSDDKVGKQDKKNRTTTTPSPTTTSGYLEEYPAIKYAFRLFNRLTDRKTEIPTTTEYTNVTLKSIDSLEEEEMAATSPSTTTVSRIVQGGVALYEGAREAYQLLQHLNKFLDRVNDRFETAGYGAEDIGIGEAAGAGDRRKE